MPKRKQQQKRQHKPPVGLSSHDTIYTTVYTYIFLGCCEHLCRYWHRRTRKMKNANLVPQ
eukprot:9483105-Pyramimonas_sp.AAC.1